MKRNHARPTGIGAPQGANLKQNIVVFALRLIGHAIKMIVGKIVKRKHELDPDSLESSTDADTPVDTDETAEADSVDDDQSLPVPSLPSETEDGRWKRGFNRHDEGGEVLSIKFNESQLNPLPNSEFSHLDKPQSNDLDEPDYDILPEPTDENATEEADADSIDLTPVYSQQQESVLYPAELVERMVADAYLRGRNEAVRIQWDRDLKALARFSPNDPGRLPSVWDNA